MKEKMHKWLEKYNYIYGCGLLFLSLCTVAFGGAYLGAEKAIDGREAVAHFDDDADNSEEDKTK